MNRLFISIRTLALFAVCIFISSILICFSVDLLIRIGLSAYLTQHNFILITNIVAQASIALIGFTALVMSVTSAITFRSSSLTIVSKKDLERIIDHLSEYKVPLASFLIALITSQIAPLFYPLFPNISFGFIVISWAHIVIGVIALFQILKELPATFYPSRIT